MEQNLNLHRHPSIASARPDKSITVLSGDVTFEADPRYEIQKGDFPMFLIAAILCLAVLVVAGAADFMQSQLSSDELSQMGVQKR